MVSAKRARTADGPQKYNIVYDSDVGFNLRWCKPDCSLSTFVLCVAETRPMAQAGLPRRALALFALKTRYTFDVVDERHQYVLIVRGGGGGGGGESYTDESLYRGIVHQ